MGILQNISLFYDIHEYDSYNKHTNDDDEAQINTQAREAEPREPDYTYFIPQFAWQSINTITRIFLATIQYVRKDTSTHITRHFRSPFPTINVPRYQ